MTLAGRTVTVRLDGATASVDGRVIEWEMGSAGSARSLLLDGRPHRVVAEAHGGGRWRIQLGARSLEAEVVDERTRAIREMTGRGSAARGPAPIKAPMPGMVVRVEVAEGDHVAAGQGVVIVEAMKMENELVAEGAGIVERVHVSRGDAVEKDQLLVSLAASDAAGPVAPTAARSSEGP